MAAVSMTSPTGFGLHSLKPHQREEENSIKLTAHVMKEGFAVEGREVKNEMLLEAQCKILQSFEDRIWGDVLKVSLMLLKAPEP